MFGDTEAEAVHLFSDAQLEEEIVLVALDCRSFAVYSCLNYEEESIHVRNECPGE